MRSAFACEAPNNDICFLQNINSYMEIDRPVGIEALAQFKNHLW